MSEKKPYMTVLANVTDTYMPLITRQLEDNDITFSDYAKQCVVFAIIEINNLLKDKGIAWNDKQLDGSNIQEILMQVAQLQLNASVSPRECYFTLRNVKQADGSWKKVIELGIEGGGADAILARFGRNVKKVYPFWTVREGDEFTYPHYRGVEMIPPEWTPHGTGKVMKIVYPVLHDDNTIHYYIAEREDVKKNLLAHINNNLINETFGIAKDRYKATPKELQEINARKKQLKDKAKAMSLEEILDDTELGAYISPAWKEDYARESMIERKMRNNIVKKIPKDFGSPYIQESFDKTTDINYKNVIDVVNEETATKTIDITPAIEIEAQSAELGESEGKADADSSVTRQTEVEPTEPQNSTTEQVRQKPDFGNLFESAN